jgi:hypothetical protein
MVLGTARAASINLGYRFSGRSALGVDPVVCWCDPFVEMEGGRMGQVRHGSATTTPAVRAAIQRSQASLATRSRGLINPKTVWKWRKMATAEYLETGPKAAQSTTLTQAEEAMVVAFRRHTLLPLDDCFSALKPPIPHLTRSALHRCLQRQGDSVGVPRTPVESRAVPHPHDTDRQSCPERSRRGHPVCRAAPCPPQP